MKKVIVVITSLVFSIGSFAQEPRTTQHYGVPFQKEGERYCAHFRDGKMHVTSAGKELATDITLPNGTRISTDGTVTKKGGVATILKSGDCIDKNGNLINPDVKGNEKVTPPEKVGGSDEDRKQQ